MSELPSGTVTFLFTDVEGSTRLWQAHPDAMGTAIARHDALLQQTVAAHGGIAFKTVGDAICAAFPAARRPSPTTRWPGVTRTRTGSATRRAWCGGVTCGSVCT